MEVGAVLASQSDAVIDGNGVQGWAVARNGGGGA
jgi:hypothetical protein